MKIPGRPKLRYTKIESWWNATWRTTHRTTLQYLMKKWGENKKLENADTRRLNLNKLWFAITATDFPLELYTGRISHWRSCWEKIMLGNIHKQLATICFQNYAKRAVVIIIFEATETGSKTRILSSTTDSTFCETQYHRNRDQKHNIHQNFVQTHNSHCSYVLFKVNAYTLFFHPFPFSQYK